MGLRCNDAPSISTSGLVGIQIGVDVCDATGNCDLTFPVQFPLGTNVMVLFEDDINVPHDGDFVLDFFNIAPSEHGFNIHFDFYQHQTKTETATHQHAIAVNSRITGNAIIAYNSGAEDKFGNASMTAYSINTGTETATHKHTYDVINASGYHFKWIAFGWNP